MTPKNKAIAKIIIGIALVIGGIFGVHLISEGVDELGKLDQMQLDVPLQK